MAVMTVATDDAVQMMEAGWTVRYVANGDCIEWRSPFGLSAHDYRSTSLDNPPPAAVAHARQCGDIKDRPRIVVR